MKKGIENEYHIEIQKIESGIQFAQVAGNVVGFLHSCAGGQMVPGLTPDPEDFLDKIKQLKYGEVGRSIFRSWQSLGDTTDEEVFNLAFNPGEENIVFETDCWPDGPTAEQTMNYINRLVNQFGAEGEPALPSWYFYLGWRVEYEYACFIQMILEDQV